MSLRDYMQECVGGLLGLLFFSVGHDGLDEFVVVDVSVGVFLALEQNVDFFLRQFLTEGGKHVTKFGRVDVAVAVLVENLETLEEVLVAARVRGLRNGPQNRQKVVQSD